MCVDNSMAFGGHDVVATMFGEWYKENEIK